MKNIKALCVSTLFVAATVSISAQAAVRSYTCAMQNPDPSFSMTENLTIDGIGKSAKVHVDDDSMSGDFTFLNLMEEQPGSAMIVGTITIKGAVPEKMDGGFFIDMSLLNGEKTGKFYRPSSESVTTFNCVQK